MHLSIEGRMLAVPSYPEVRAIASCTSLWLIKITNKTDVNFFFPMILLSYSLIKVNARYVKPSLMHVRIYILRIMFTCMALPIEEPLGLSV
jgi:hypothetical protein